MRPQAEFVLQIQVWAAKGMGDAAVRDARRFTQTRAVLGGCIVFFPSEVVSQSLPHAPF